MVKNALFALDRTKLMTSARCVRWMARHACCKRARARQTGAAACSSNIGHTGIQARVCHGKIAATRSGCRPYPTPTLNRIARWVTAAVSHLGRDIAHADAAYGAVRISARRVEDCLPCWTAPTVLFRSPDRRR